MSTQRQFLSIFWIENSNVNQPGDRSVRFVITISYQERVSGCSESHIVAQAEKAFSDMFFKCLAIGINSEEEGLN